MYTWHGGTLSFYIYNTYKACITHQWFYCSQHLYSSLCMSTGQTCAEDDAEDVSSMAFLQAIVQALVCQYRCLLGRKRLAGWADWWAWHPTADEMGEMETFSRGFTNG